MAERELDLSDLWSIEAKGPNVLVKIKDPGNALSAINSASAQKGSEMNGFTKFLTGVAMVLGGLWLVAGLFYYYGQIDKAPPLWPTGSHERGIDNTRLGGTQFRGIVLIPPLTSTVEAPPVQQGFGNVPDVWTSHGPDSCKQFGLSIGQQKVIDGQLVVCRPD